MTRTAQRRFVSGPPATTDGQRGSELMTDDLVTRLRAAALEAAVMAVHEQEAER